MVKNRLSGDELIYSVGLFLISFLLNLVWETLHSNLYASNSLLFDSFDSFFSLMLYASFIDAILILFMYLFLVFVFGDLYWLGERFEKKGRAVYFGLIAIFIAVIIEIRALLTNRWEYRGIMPTILGIGLTPLFQLAVTGLLAIILSYVENGFISSIFEQS